MFPRALLLVSLIGLTSVADPCGMVPPIFAGDGPPITRIGLQKTYVFFKDGVESIVLRPGFSGKVAEFGMLIPFPSPPALRKMADSSFPQLAAAIDPPEVLLENFWPPRPGAAMPRDGAMREEGLELNRVTVLKQEAVGMYEVAVLEAGSAAALKRWMDDHGFRYPEGMDATCEEYVIAGWCFVAVKARVGSKAGVDPQPGMRDADPALPAGAGFDGHVQAMGFRFETDALVIPMRLSAFNEGELHNVVYLLSDQPMRLDGIDASMVVRQVPGAELLRNLREPLPLRSWGASLEDTPLRRLRELQKERDPAPHNGVARDLFASDLAAVHRGELSLPHEEAEKQLLQIGEHLSLRGAAIDGLHRELLAAQQAELNEEVLQGLEGMTLSVIDGDFPRELLAAQNLRALPYTMPADKNTPALYHAPSAGPQPQPGGELVDDAVLAEMLQELEELLRKEQLDDGEQQRQPAWQLAVSAPILLLLCLFGLRLRRLKGVAGSRSS